MISLSRGYEIKETPRLFVAKPHLDVSGVPGLGKTACILEVIRKIEAQQTFSFKFVAINGLKLPQAKAIYRVLAKEIFGLDLSVEASCKALGSQLLSRTLFHDWRDT